MTRAAPLGAVRYALAAVKGVGPQAMQAIVAERTTGGPFKDLADFARRVDPKAVNKRMMEALAKAGAFDELNPNRAQLFAGIELLLRHAGVAGGGAHLAAGQPVRRRRAGAHRTAQRLRLGAGASGCTTSSRRSASTSRRIRSTSMPKC